MPWQPSDTRVTENGGAPVEVTRDHVPRVYFASRADTSRSRTSEIHAFLAEDGWEIELIPWEKGGGQR